MRRPGRITAVVLAVAVASACSHTDGRELADPDPDLTATTAAPAAAGGASPGSQEDTVPPTSAGAGGLTVASPAFEPGGPMPARFTCMGGDASPPLTWSAVPDDAVELAIVVRSPSAGEVPYWLVTGIDPTTSGLDEGQQPAAVVPWTGPCPTSGTRHQYVFSLYALRQPFEPPSGSSATEVAAQLAAAEPRPATVTATFTR